MNIGKFVRDLLPSFDKKQIIEDLKVTRDELEETLPPLKSAKDFFMSYTFKSKAAEDLQKRFVKETGDTKVPNFIVAVCRMVEAVDNNLSTLERMVDKYFAEDVVKDGMTYVKANLLQYVQLTTFSVRFARHLVLWTYQVESNKVNPSSQIEMTKGELKWLENNLSDFFKVYPILSVSKENLERTVANIPDALITTDNVDTLAATVGLKRLDPFEMNFVVGVNWNVIYHVRIAIAEWQISRYKVAKEERNVLELRLMHLQTLAEGRNDAKLEEQIRYNEDRLQRMKAKILKIEEDAND